MFCIFDLYVNIISTHVLHCLKQFNIDEFLERYSYIYMTTMWRWWWSSSSSSCSIPFSDFGFSLNRCSSSSPSSSSACLPSFALIQAVFETLCVCCGLLWERKKTNITETNTSDATGFLHFFDVWLSFSRYWEYEIIDSIVMFIIRTKNIEQLIPYFTKIIIKT